MKRTSRGSISAITAIFLSLVLTACGSNDATEAANTPQQGGSIVDLALFTAGDPESIDPARSNNTDDIQFKGLLYDGLTATDVNGEVQNAVASNYSANPEATVWTFEIRNGVKFSDGTPVLPSSFKRAWERVLNPVAEFDNAGRMGPLELEPGTTTLRNVVADDDARTLTVTLNQPDGDLPALFSLPQFSPMPTSAPADTSWESTTLIGNGPFMMDGPWERGNQIKVVRNPNYYGGFNNKLAYLDSINFRISGSRDAAYNDFAAGRGQIGMFPSTATADLQKYAKEDILNYPTMGTEFFGFGMNDPLIGGPENLKFRQAVDKALNKAEINQVFTGGTSPIASQFSASVTPGSDSEPSNGQPDIGEAKRLLAEWGKTPPAMKVSYRDSLEGERMVALMVRDLNAVGIPAVANPQPLDAYRKAVTSGEAQFFKFTWIADYPSYRTMIAPPFSTSSVGEDNFTRYSNTEVDRLFADAQSSPSPGKRHELYRQAEDLIMADQPVIPITWTAANYIKAPQVQNLTADPLAYIQYENVWLRR